MSKGVNEDMKQALCKCFTGRINRIINSLNGFSDLVKIEIGDNSQISNIIIIIKSRLGDEYTIEKHKELVKKELLERGYESKTIDEWISYIE